ncbi:unnamed protein product [Closterium sp. NIES-53]
MAAQELRWLTYLLTDLGEPPRSPPVLYVDNKAMLALCREQRLEHRTKHIALRYFLARELQQRGQLRLAYVASEANTADVFTKVLAPCDHQRCCTQLGLLCFALLNWDMVMEGAEDEEEKRDGGSNYTGGCGSGSYGNENKNYECGRGRGGTYSMTPRADLLTELEPSLVKHVTSALGQRAKVKGMGKAMFKGADGKMVGLKNILLVPNLAANLIFVRRLQKAGMDTSSKGAKTYTARLGERIL